MDRSWEPDGSQPIVMAGGASRRDPTSLRLQPSRKPGGSVELQHPASRRPPWIDASIAISITALAIAILALWRTASVRPPTSRVPETSLERTKRERVLRVGYGAFPPYTIVNLNETDPHKRVTGFCVDMIEQMAARQNPPWRVEWHQVSWETLRADMYSGKFDVLPNAIYQTLPRASEFLFSIPFTYVGVGVAVVRSNEQRIRTFTDLNEAGITVSLAEGWTATEYAREHLDPRRLLIKPVGEDINAQLNDLLSGRADAVLQDVPTALSWRAAHPRTVKILWLDRPPMLLPASFITRFDDTEMMNFLNTAIRVLQADGTIQRLDERWKGMGEYPATTFSPGSGLRQR